MRDVAKQRRKDNYGSQQQKSLLASLEGPKQQVPHVLHEVTTSEHQVTTAWPLFLFLLGRLWVGQRDHWLSRQRTKTPTLQWAFLFALPRMDKFWQLWASVCPSVKGGS